ncbi:kirola-like [Cucumis melo var. makuwa]|uniref:Kirola-like n=1 Tax=Cucumis melo var. makuwa TaxID=1194695 RepID=A0A5D3DZV2_CUCMM|nr:kirola-like [Cucumis melo var. makuwa]TYK29293.1 kirola-like [Cucumis melo var. makuwa]
MVSEREIEQTLNNTTSDGNQTEETGTNFGSPPSENIGKFYIAPHASIHVLPRNSGWPPSLLLSNLYALPTTDFSYYPNTKNLQIHSTFEVGESSAHFNPNVQASSSGITQQQLEGLRQHITAIGATLGTTSNTSVPMYFENVNLSLGRMISTARHSRGLYLLDDNASSSRISRTSLLSSYFTTSEKDLMLWHFHLGESVSEESNYMLPLESTCPTVVTLPDLALTCENDWSKTVVLEDMGEQGVTIVTSQHDCAALA